MQYMPEGSTNWYNEDGSIAVDGMSDVLDQANASTPSSAKSSSDIDYSDVNSTYQAILDAINEERSWNAQQAEYARDFTAEENRKARNFNSAEAQAERDWQTEMSNTSYQRAMADMKAAGLNPVLAAKFGGASSGSGASASSSGSSGAAASSSGAGSTLVSLLSKFIDAQTTITKTSMDNQASMARTIKSGEIEEDIAFKKHNWNIEESAFEFRNTKALDAIKNDWKKLEDANDFYGEWMKMKDNQEFQENMALLQAEVDDYLKSTHSSSLVNAASNIMHFFCSFYTGLSSLNISTFLDSLEKKDNPDQILSYAGNMFDDILHSISNDSDITGQDRVNIMDTAFNYFTNCGDADSTEAYMKKYLSNTYGHKWSMSNG